MVHERVIRYESRHMSVFLAQNSVRELWVLWPPALSCLPLLMLMALDLWGSIQYTKPSYGEGSGHMCTVKQLSATASKDPRLSSYMGERLILGSGFQKFPSTAI